MSTTQSQPQADKDEATSAAAEQPSDQGTATPNEEDVELPDGDEADDEPAEGDPAAEDLGAESADLEPVVVAPGVLEPGVVLEVDDGFDGLPTSEPPGDGAAPLLEEPNQGAASAPETTAVMPAVAEALDKSQPPLGGF